MDESEQYLEKLRGHVSVLKKLLDDPQPGLFVWCQMYGKEMQAISDMWNQPELKADDQLTG